MEAPPQASTTREIPVPAGLSGAIQLFSPELLDGPGLVAALGKLESLINWAHAGQARVLHLLEQNFLDSATRDSVPAASESSGTVRTALRRLDEDLATSLAATEAACALRIPERTALGKLRTARLLCEDFPATLTALRNGQLNYRQAETVVDDALLLPPGARAGFEKHLLACAPTQTTAELARSSRREREKHHPETVLQRARKAAADRRVALTPDLDGMCWFSAYLPADTATAAYNRLTTLARVVQGPDEPRTLTQLRADVLADLLTKSFLPASGSDPSAPADVLVTMDVQTLLGIADHPAELEGYGPVSPETARELAALSGSFLPLLTCEGRNVLAMGRKARLPSTTLRRWLRYRDETCRFPGCGRSAAQSDIDHSIPWSRGGPTDHGNLAHLCRKHHMYKSATCWNLLENDAGTLKWKSPTGRHYTTAPPGQLAEPPPF